MRVVLRPSGNLPDGFLPDHMYGVAVDCPGVTRKSTLIVSSGLARATDRIEIHDGGPAHVWIVRNGKDHVNNWLDWFMNLLTAGRWEDGPGAGFWRDLWVMMWSDDERR